MTTDPTTDTMSGDGIPRVTDTTGYQHGRPGPCVGCGQSVDVGEDYLALWVPEGNRTRLLGVAHHGRYLDVDWEHFDNTCPQALRSRWDQALSVASAVRLTLGADGGGCRFYAGDVALHAGSRLEVLTAANVWLAGRFEYEHRPAGLEAFLYVVLVGYDTRATPLHVPVDTVIRVPERLPW
jgi:hypothetical protein